MGKSLYEIKLTNNIISCSDADKAVEEWGEMAGTYLKGFATATEIVSKKDTAELFMLAKMMEDNDHFDYEDIEAAVLAVLRNRNYHMSAKDAAECILSCVERFSNMTIEEVQEWILD